MSNGEEHYVLSFDSGACTAYREVMAVSRSLRKIEIACSAECPSNRFKLRAYTKSGFDDYDFVKEILSTGEFSSSKTIRFKQTIKRLKELVALYMFVEFEGESEHEVYLLEPGDDFQVATVEDMSLKHCRAEFRVYSPPPVIIGGGRP